MASQRDPQDSSDEELQVKTSGSDFVHFSMGESSLTKDMVRQLFAHPKFGNIAEEWIASMETPDSLPKTSTNAAKTDNTGASSSGMTRGKSSMNLDDSQKGTDAAAEQDGPEDSSETTLVLGDSEKKRKNRMRQKQNKSKGKKK